MTHAYEVLSKCSVRAGIRLKKHWFLAWIASKIFEEDNFNQLARGRLADCSMRPNQLEHVEKGPEGPWCPLKAWGGYNPSHFLTPPCCGFDKPNLCKFHVWEDSSGRLQTNPTCDFL